MKICIVSDNPQVAFSGAIVTYTNMIELGKKQGIEIDFVNPSFWPKQFRVMASLYPTKYSQLAHTDGIEKFLDNGYDHYHLASEQILGSSAKKYLLDNKINFSSAYHCHYIQYKILNNTPNFTIEDAWNHQKEFHSPSTVVLVPCQSMKNTLDSKNFHTNTKLWARGIDFNIFKNKKKKNKQRQTNLIYFGRISDEKNLEEVCKLGVKYSINIIGDGPARKKLEYLYPTVKFSGFKSQSEIVNILEQMDVCVFPSRTETFGLTMIEAMACGVPVAAYPSTGVYDIVQNGVNGFYGDNLEESIEKCLTLDNETVSESVQNYRWENCFNTFLQSLVKAH